LASLESFNHNLAEILREIRPPISQNEELMFELSNVLNSKQDVKQKSIKLSKAFQWTHFLV
jgi:hypothetical protein